MPNPENVNSGIEYFCQVTSITDARKRACLHLLAQVGREKAFDFLRTKLQLGYLIWSGVRETITTEGYFNVTTYADVDIELLFKVKNRLHTLKKRLRYF